ncbi:DUF2017 domain-containing protein [Mycolicibacterium sp.]|uniref:oxidative stress transcriptional regulator AosR n=1 Tax=Mycolicibacterium sp. TaxID=2320850 RepID=UPI001A247FC7|nr:DUF2017 domain-containing protein [Mycolicibacterium sp.]MBJ7400490.1 DUF2017 domain-containing protein [Mycolicibacterium sp.]
MRKWRRVQGTEGARFVSALEPHEVALLKNMATSIQEMLGDRQSATPSDPLEQITGIRTGNPEPPGDVTMRRLLPDFVKDGQPGLEDRDDSNSVLRSLHEPEIIDAKITAAQRLLDTLPDGGGPLELTEADANAWIAAVNDIRLALGTMLEIGPDVPDRLPADHPMATQLEVYQWLTVLQEYLVLGLMGKPIR